MLHPSNLPFFQLNVKKAEDQAALVIIFPRAR